MGVPKDYMTKSIEKPKYNLHAHEMALWALHVPYNTDKLKWPRSQQIHKVNMHFIHHYQSACVEYNPQMQFQ